MFNFIRNLFRGKKLLEDIVVEPIIDPIEPVIVNRLKIFGMQRTGTTFLEMVLQTNLRSVRTYFEFGNKHVAPFSLDGMTDLVSHEQNSLRRQQLENMLDEIKQGDLLQPIIIIKNPYSWYQSIKRFKGKQFDIGSEYGKYNKTYIGMKDLIENGNCAFHKGYLITYEDLVNDEQISITKLCTELDMEMTDSFVVPDKISQAKKFTNKRRDFYLSGGTFGLPRHIVGQINELVDWELMEFYGYGKKE